MAIGQTIGVVTFGTSSLALGLLDIKGPDFARKWLDTTNMGTAAATSAGMGNMTGIPSVYTDPGEVELSVQHDQAYPNVAAALAIGSTLETITITAGPKGSSTQAKIVGTGALVKYKADAPLNGKIMTATATIRFSGIVTPTAAT